jgi:hypothetical protein
MMRMKYPIKLPRKILALILCRNDSSVALSPKLDIITASTKATKRNGKKINCILFSKKPFGVPFGYE